MRASAIGWILSSLPQTPAAQVAAPRLPDRRLGRGLEFRWVDTSAAMGTGNYQAVAALATAHFDHNPETIRSCRSTSLWPVSGI